MPLTVEGHPPDTERAIPGPKRHHCFAGLPARVVVDQVVAVEETAREGPSGSVTSELTDPASCTARPGVRRAGLMRVNGSVVLGQTRVLVAAGG